MPIIENVNGVLHTHNAELENVGGVIREKESVIVNDGGVLREIFHANKGATVEGITPLVAADDHIVIVDSGSFTLSAPAGARIIVGGAAKNTVGGNVAEYTLESAIKNAQCTVQCAAIDSGGATTLTVDGTTYVSGSVKQIIQSKWGPIGGDGGYLAHGNFGIKVTDGTGAGGGGAARKYGGQIYTNGKGGNKGGYGNFGGNGGNSNGAPFAVGEDGASGKGGNTSSYGNFGGGGGGFSAGGGTSGSVSDYGDCEYSGYNSEGGAGIVVIEW